MGPRQSLLDDNRTLPPAPPLASADPGDGEHPLYWTTPRRAPTDLSAIHSPSARRILERRRQQQQRAVRSDDDYDEEPGTAARLFFRSSTMWTGTSSSGGREMEAERRRYYRQQQQPPPPPRQWPAAAPAKGERRAGGGPLPRQLLNIHNHRPRSAADYGLMASAFLSGEARANGGDNSGDSGFVAAAGRADSTRVGTDATAAVEDDGGWAAKHVGTQCDLMSEVVLKFSRNTLQGAVELSSLHDILRRFAAVAHPLVGAGDNGSSPLLQRVAAATAGGPIGVRLHVATDSDATSTLPTSAGGGGDSLYAAAIRSRGFDIPYGGGGDYFYADSVATESSAYCRLSTDGTGGGAAAIASQSDGLDWPDHGEGGGGKPSARKSHDRTAARVTASAAASAAEFRSAEGVPAALLPPVDYNPDTTTSSAADAATTSSAAIAASVSTAVTKSHASATDSVDFASAREHLRIALKVKAPAVARDGNGSIGGGDRSREAKAQATSSGTAISAAEALGGAVRDADDTLSRHSNADIATSVRDENIIAGVGLGYRMSWKHASDAYNVLIPRPRVVQETISASTVSTERSTTSDFEDADVVDIRL